MYHNDINNDEFIFIKNSNDTFDFIDFCETIFEVAFEDMYKKK